MDKNAWKEKLLSIYQIFSSDKTKKGARITYGVVWNILLVFLIVIILGTAFAGGVGAGYFASLVKDEPLRSYESMQKDIYNYEETSEVYFANNVYLGKLRSDIDREEVKLEDVSDHLKNALIATEDEYFWEHPGIVPKAILRALYQEFSNSALQSGGSTLTQQLIKNQILTSQVSFDRKAKEILLALRLEKFFTKEQILEAYLNVSPFGRNSSGRNIAGVQTAAKGIFGVDAAGLSLPQAAFIAGLPQSPFAYTPFTQDGKVKSAEGLAPGIERMKTVLTRMYEEEFISKEEFDQAMQYDITKDFAPPEPSPIEEYPWLTFEVEKRATQILMEIIAKEDGLTMEDLKANDDLYNEYYDLAYKNLRQNGYSIHTTIDKEIYDKMQEVAKNFPYYGNDKPEEDPETGEIVMEPVETGAVLIENATGRIISFVGGRDHSREQTNHATDATRQNGSTMKPLLVYAPAFELGTLQPASIIPDVKLVLDDGTGKSYEPKNYSKGYNGLTTARYALTKSFNIPAVKAYVDILQYRPADYLKKMGFTSLTEGDYYNIAMALGGMTYGVTVEENVNAYATFANDGKFIDAYMIEKIVNKDGETIYKHESKPVDVFSRQTAYLTIDMMRDVITEGTAAGLPGRLNFRADWAGKTGTSQDTNDSWFVATNPNVTFGVWIGYDTPKTLEPSYKSLSPGVRNIYLWADLMNAAYEINPDLVAPKENFEMPGGIVQRSYCTVSGMLPSELCADSGLVATDIFNAKFVPTETDNSLIEGRYVTIGDKRYLALETTPEEFTQEGLLLSPEFIEKMGGKNLSDPKQLIPSGEKWSKILVPDNVMKENGKVPAPLTISSSGQTLTWKAHGENDVVGYRVYQKKGDNSVTVVGNVLAGKDLSFQAGNGQFYVIAVDIAGQESKPSNLIQVGEAKPDSSTGGDTETTTSPDQSENPANGNGNGKGKGNGNQDTP
ncbi:MAG TPA: transglycosylase domain-containing protein [Bacillus sp. (in: firmicutes)]|uniref:transglycosylase domain-containing protein n=1 Tax=Bacillus litorisediminis TaxID=2922713 RepID=UPI001FAF8829|nr:transglycosylase domain-containing protein [Bacillus litorisediminis]HWO75461.1 transglycosylase domain-containing protein [Bacillus sp. (in: firmicutes)]